MRRAVATLLFLALLGPLGLPAAAGTGEAVAEREGDNRIYFTWSATEREVSKATSSRRLIAGQRIEVLTSLKDGTGWIVMKAVLRNTSRGTTYVVDGRLVHRVMRGTDVVRTRGSESLHEVLGPGEKIISRFRYRLSSGEYAARTDFDAD
jgi:hypothetical protein